MEALALVCGFVDRWQTLIAGMLALIGALATVYMLRMQIKQQRAENIELRRRKFMAARAMLPADLSTICQYTAECAELVRGVYKHHHRYESLPEALPEAPVLAQSVLDNLQRLIEHLEEPDAEMVADLLACYQVQKARLDGAIREWAESQSKASGLAISKKHIEHPLMETVSLHLSAENAFDFARREVDHIAAMPSLTSEAVRRALKLMLSPGFPRFDADEQLLRSMQFELVPGTPAPRDEGD